MGKWSSFPLGMLCGFAVIAAIEGYWQHAAFVDVLALARGARHVDHDVKVGEAWCLRPDAPRNATPLAPLLVLITYRGDDVVQYTCKPGWEWSTELGSFLATYAPCPPGHP